MASLSLHGITKRFGQLQTIHGVDLDIDAGEFVVFVGPSGCGKSTLLRMIAGLEDASGGRILIDGADMTAAAPSERRVAMVFQSYALYPHMTVRDNLSFGMRMRKVDKDVIARKLARAVGMLGLGDYLDRKPGELSGGQCQRVAIGRAMVQEPAIYLFDEPLSNLDAELRLRMRVEISALHREVGKTMIYVTHDQVEAMTLADKMVVLRAGRIEQVGHPLALYANPCNAFVAGFVGSPAMNMLEAELEADPKADPKAKPGAMDGSGIARLADGTRIPCVLAQAGAAGPCTIGVRPEHWQRSADGAEGAVRAVVNAVERLGATAYVHAAAGKATLCIEDRSGAPPRPGDCIAVAPLQGMTYVFDRDGRTISAPKAAPVAA